MFSSRLITKIQWAKKLILLLFAFWFWSLNGNAQDTLGSNSSVRKGFINRIHNKLYNHNQAYHYLYNRFWAVDTNKSLIENKQKNDFVIIPFVTYEQETSFKFGLASDYSFYTHADSTTRISSQTGKLSYSLDHQYSIELNPDIWTSYNRYHFTGALQYESFPSYFYGIGYNTLDSNKLLLSLHQYYIDLEAEKKIFPAFRLGLTLTTASYNYNFSSNNSFFLKYPNYYAVKGGNYFFTGFSITYDTRDYLHYTSQGTYLQVKSDFNIKGLSTLNNISRFNFTGIEYFSFSKKFILGFNAIYNTTFGQQVPFFLLNQLGGANIERGYYTGRFRDKSLLAGQVEFKYRLIPRLAFAAFGGTGTTWGYEPFSTSEFKPSFGGGIRYFFSVQNKITIRLDYGVGEKLPNEARSHGFYFSLGEAF